jgi:hypothetical protein
VKWEDGVDNDVKALGERSWKNLSRNRQIWQNLLRKAMAQKGCFPVMMMMMNYFLYYRLTLETS